MIFITHFKTLLRHIKIFSRIINNYKRHLCTKSENTHEFELVVGLLIETDSLDNHLSHLQEFNLKVCCKFFHFNNHRVGIAVAGGAPVLQVAVALLGHVPRDPDAAAPVGNPGREVVDGGSLVSSGEPTLVVLAC